MALLAEAPFCWWNVEFSLSFFEKERTPLLNAFERQEMILTDKINELNSAVEKTAELLNEAKTLQGELIANEINTAKSEITSELKSKITDELSDELNFALQNELKQRTSRSALNEIIMDNVENNAVLMNRVLALAEFEKKLSDKIAEEVEIYNNTFLRYQNAHSVLAVCLQNELASIAAATASIAQIEFYNEALTSGKPAFKVWHEI